MFRRCLSLAIGPQKHELGQALNQLRLPLLRGRIVHIFRELQPFLLRDTSQTPENLPLIEKGKLEKKKPLIPPPSQRPSAWVRVAAP